MRFARLPFDVRHLLVVVAFALSLVATPAQATVIFDDGGDHEIDSVFEDVQVFDSPEGKGTDLWILPTGDISELDGTSASVFDRSYIMVYGTLRGGLVLADDSFGKLGANERAPTVQGNVEVKDTAELIIYGGTIAGNTEIKGSSSSSIWGGTFQGELGVQDESVIRVFDGMLQGALSSEDNGIMYLQGRDFRIDGSPVDFGPIPVRDGTISGELWGGDPLSTTFSISDDAQIVLVPEPPAMLLAVLGCLGVSGYVRRRQQRPAAECRR